MSCSALLLGIAFQIPDDILGIFGSEAKLGKPVGSDIQEGKLTLLVAYALETGTHDQQRELRRILSEGAAMTANDIECFKNILVETKALERAQEASRKYIQEGKRVLEEVRGVLPQRSFDFFEAIADYMAEREYYI